MASTSTPRPLRIALVTETYPPEVNGVASTVARVVDGLRERGHVVQVVRPRQAGDEHRRDDGAACAHTAAPDLLVRGLPIPRYPDLRLGLPCRRTLRQAWTACRPDAVHVVTEGPLGWSALQAARDLGLPVVSDFRTNFQTYSDHYGIGWLRTPIMAYLRHFHNRTACTMVPTEALRSELAATGLQRLKVVARGVDTRLFHPARRSLTLRASWGAGPRTMVALCVGRLAPEKNLDGVLAAAEAMGREYADTRLVLVGDGPDKPRLMQRCPSARFAGMRRAEDLAAHYASADVFLFPSVTETFGNVVPEAMASGLAVLAYDHAAAGQLIRHGENGLLARLGDSAGFCHLATRLAGDLERRQALGEQARRTAQQLDWLRIVVAVEMAYRAAIPRQAVLPAAPTAAISEPAPPADRESAAIAATSRP